MALLRMYWLPVVDRACCCALEVFSLIIGYLSALCSCAVMLGLFALLISDKYFSTYHPMLFWIWILTLIVEGFVCFVLSIVFIMGVYQKRHAQLTPFVIFLHLRLAVSIHLAIFVGNLVPVLTLPGTLPFIGLLIYILTCVNSLRVKFAEAETVGVIAKESPSAPPKNNLV